MKQINPFHTRHRRLGWPIVLLMLFMSPGMARAVEYVTLNSGSGYTYSYLVGNCSGKHVKVNGNGSVQLNVSGNLNIKELFAPTASVTIVLTNGATLNITQDADNENAAINVKGLTITTSDAYQGNVVVSAPHTGIAIQEDGKVQVNVHSLLKVTSHTDAAVRGMNNAELEVNNGVLSLNGATEAIRPWSTTYVTTKFTVKGAQSHVEVRGSIGGDHAIQSFTVEDCSYMNITGNNLNTAVRAMNVNISGGKIYVTQVGGTAQYTDADGIYATRYATISNCQLEVNSAAGDAIRVDGPLVINNANVRALAPSGKSGIYVWEAQLLGNNENSKVMAVGPGYGLYCQSTLHIANHSLIARGSTSGITASVINITPQPGCTYQAYGLYPFLAIKQYSLSPEINLTMPTRIIGSLSTSNTNYRFEGGGVISYNVPSESEDPALVFAQSNGTIYSGLVELKQPHIYNITGSGANGDYNLLGGNQDKYTTPGKTVAFDFSPLNPYLTYDNPTKTIKLYKRRYSSGGSDEITFVQQWTNTTANSVSWTMTEADVYYMYWCDVSLDAYEGTLSTYQYHVVKGSNSAQPVTPIVGLNNNTIRVTNGRSDQEYIVIPESDWNTFLNDMNSPGGPLSPWWENSIKPTANGAVNLIGMGTHGVVNHVVTRFKETQGYEPGSRYAAASIFYGSSVQLQSAELALTAVGNNYVNPDFEGTYSTKLNGVIKLEAKPIPANATNFYGVRGDSWACTYMTSGAQPFLFYANQACTTPLDYNTYYTTVYVKANREGYKWSLIANAYDGDPESSIPAAKAEVNISDANGVFRPYKLLVNHGEELTSHSTTVTGIPFEVIPSNATFDGDVTVTFANVTGPFPSFAAQTDRIPTFTVDKVNRTINMTPNTKPMIEGHTYRFSVRHKVNGTTYGEGTLKVQVVEPPLYSLSISPAQVTLDTGQSLPLEITSDLPDAWRHYNTDGRTTCVSSDESVATVKWDWYNNLQTWFVTATDDPSKIGQSATITLTVNGIEATCQVTIAGESYPITIAGTKINSANCDDVLGNGKVRYAAGTLYLNNLGINTPTGATGAIQFDGSEALPVLNIEAQGTNLIQNTSGPGFVFGGDVVVSGNGTFDCRGNTFGIYGSSSSLTVNDGALVHALGNNRGLRVGSLSVTSGNAQVKAKGGSWSMYIDGKQLWGTISEPAGAYLDDNGYVSLGGNVVNNQYVVINGVTSQSAIAGDVNGDGLVTSSDVTALYKFLLYNDDSDIVNGDQAGNDNVITTADVTAVYKILLGN